MRKIRLERLNMKWILTIGAIIIIVLTILFVIFKTNLIIDHSDEKGKDKGKDKNYCTINCDTDGDGICDLNCDFDGDGKCDFNCDTDGDGTCDLNCDTDGDDTCDLNCDTDGDGVCDLNCDTDGNGLCNLNCDTDGNGTCDVNCDTDGDGNCDVNCQGEIKISGGNGSNSNEYPDPEESNKNGVSDAAKNRTKPVEDLNEDERLYIIEENIDKDMKDLKDDDLKLYQDTCTAKEPCEYDATDYGEYSDKTEYGYWIMSCSGKVSIWYEGKDLKKSFDNVKCS